MPEITNERYNELITAEYELKQLKSLIKKKLDRYEDVDRDELKLLYMLYCEKEEQEC